MSPVRLQDVRIQRAARVEADGATVVQLRGTPRTLVRVISQVRCVLGGGSGPSSLRLLRLNSQACPPLGPDPGSYGEGCGHARGSPAYTMGLHHRGGAHEPRPSVSVPKPAPVACRLARVLRRAAAPDSGRRRSGLRHGRGSPSTTLAEDGYAPSLLPIAANVAARTHQIRIGTFLILLPLHNALRVAEDAATVDILSNGRLDLGFGQGYAPNEFEGFGISRRERASRLREGVEVVRGAFTQSPFSYSGKHYQIKDIELLAAARAESAPPDLGRSSGTDRREARGTPRLSLSRNVGARLAGALRPDPGRGGPRPRELRGDAACTLPTWLRRESGRSTTARNTCTTC